MPGRAAQAKPFADLPPPTALSSARATIYNTGSKPNPSRQTARMKGRASTETIAQLLRPLAQAVEPALAAALGQQSVPAPLAEAMRYAALDGGKRLRPALVLLSAEAVADRNDWPMDPTPAAVAVELVHCYSLVHDDLPAMDDDSLRRGRPTCHVKFGQAMAILAGDALLTRAFEILARAPGDKATAARLVAELAGGAGPAGLIAGQVADMALCPVPAGEPGRQYIHMRKTAALIRAAVRMGAICAGADDADIKALTTFAEKLGLAFQIADDLLDATESAQVLGKTPGKDADSGKRTYATELSAEQARRQVEQLTAQACKALEPLGERAGNLKRLAVLLARRDR